MCNNCYHSKGRAKKAWKCETQHKTALCTGNLSKLLPSKVYKSKFILINFFNYLDASPNNIQTKTMTI